MKFIFQKDVNFDFIYYTKEAIRYYEWYNDTQIIVIESYFEELNNCLKLDDNYIPIGSVEFVHMAMKIMSGNFDYEPNQINVPNKLCKKLFTKRDIVRVKSDEYKNNSGRLLYYKSDNKVKGLSGTLNPNESLSKSDWFISEEIKDIKSEYRGFVLDGKLIDLKLYSGDFRVLPNIELIDAMVEEYGKKEPYTIDVGVSDLGTFVIEVHRFYSCGLYGFSDYPRLIKMIMGTYDELKKLYVR